LGPESSDGRRRGAGDLKFTLAKVPSLSGLESPKCPQPSERVREACSSNCLWEQGTKNVGESEPATALSLQESKADLNAESKGLRMAGRPMRYMGLLPQWLKLCPDLGREKGGKWTRP
jgi:hypothetical protein